MMKELGFIFAIILHTSYSLHPRNAVISEPTLPTDPISDLSIKRDDVWLRDDDLVNYSKDAVQDFGEHSRSPFHSSWIDRVKKIEETLHPELQSSQRYQPEVENEEYEAHGEGDEDGYETDEKQENHDKHLFNPSEPWIRGNLEQFKQQKSHILEVVSENTEKPQQRLTELNIKNNNPSVARVKKPAVTDFSYIRPEEWFRQNPECSGKFQSPVNLETDKLVFLEVPSSLIWTGYWNHPENMTIMDNGHSVELSGTWDEKKIPFISGGPLVGDYLFSQLHFHWGPKDSVGSEHTINNKTFPMEMHMVHYKRDYGTPSEALKHDDGLAVVAFLFEISDTMNFGINFLSDSLGIIQNKPGARIAVNPYPLAFLHFILQENYLAYVGSLTTPPCREIVTWLVSSTPLTISRKQLESFRRISNKWPEKENYRPRQALNGRRLYYVAH